MGGSKSKEKDSSPSEEVEMQGDGEDSGDKGKYGEPVKYDPTFNGPIKKRSCTDIICCLLFLIVMAASAILAYFAFINGDPNLLIYPTDSFGKLCGYGNFKDKPNLVFFDMLTCARMGPSVLINGCPTPQVCVASCPNKTWAFAETDFLEAPPMSKPQSETRKDMICKYHVDPAAGIYQGMSAFQLMSKDYCAPYYVQSSPFVGRCIPSIFKDAVDALAKTAVTVVVEGQTLNLTNSNNDTVTNELLSKGSEALAAFLSVVEIGKATLSDLQTSWWLIVIALCVSALLGLVWILLMRWIAGIMVWLSVALFIGMFSFSTYYCFSKYVALKDLPSANGNFYFTTNLSYYLGLKDTWLAFGIISAIFLGVIVLILIVLRARILIAIALIKETSKAIGSMMFTLLWPIWPFIIQAGIIGYWAAVTVYLASWSDVKSQYTVNGTNSSDGNGGVAWSFPPCDIAKIANQDIQKLVNQSDELNTACQFLKYEIHNYVIPMQIFNLFVFFWLFNFVIAFGQMTLAGAFASYYWAFSKPKDIPTFPIVCSIWRCFRYHLGSLAFGSLIIAIVQLIRAMLEYIDSKVKGTENPFAKFVIKCMKCCFWCLEKFLKFINKNAYILVAVYGKNFCTSAKNAFFLLMRNILRVVVVDKTTGFCLLIAKLVVVGATVSLSYFFFDGSIPHLSKYAPQLTYYFVPLIVITIGSYIIATMFFNVYSMGVDTMFLCFLEDLERHDGSPEKPYYMSKELMKILGKKNKKVPGEGKKKDK
ncbi:choline transporter-like protein 2 isoform X3 [Lineus longissimus]|uniref:choline transporter-like protein 2 isoform X3 n=1 Tax=Lineus longissimus TaxID=88925 RepID=UPI00315CAE92